MTESQDLLDLRLDRTTLDGLCGLATRRGLSLSSLITEALYAHIGIPTLRLTAPTRSQVEAAVKSYAATITLGVSL